MAAINMSLAARSEYVLHQLAKRQKNWAQREVGVIIVLIIVFLVLVLVIAMFINKRVSLRCAFLMHSFTSNPFAEASRQGRRHRFHVKIPPTASRIKADMKQTRGRSMCMERACV